MQAALRVIPSSFTVAIRWDVAKAFNFGGTRRREVVDSHGLRCAAPSSHTIIHAEEFRRSGTLRSNALCSYTNGSMDVYGQTLAAQKHGHLEGKGLKLERRPLD